MSYRYLITLRPLAPFFFGAEQTFGADEARKESSRYRAVSTLFPQQSALLGMLRKTLLRQAGLMTLHKRGEWVNKRNFEAAQKLVGTGSFSYKEPFDTGLIESISPLFVRHEGSDYTLEATDASYTPKLSDESVMLQGKKRRLVTMEGYNPKAPHAQQFVSKEGASKTLEVLFKEVESVGIKKGRGGQTEEKAFYMKKSFQAKADTEFAFVLTLKEVLEIESSLVQLGADASPFVLKVEKTELGYRDRFEGVVHPKPVSRVVALSDLLIDREAFESVEMVFGKRIERRHIVRQEKKQRYAIAKSQTHWLFERGTVLYTQTPEELEKKIAKEHLQKLGLNHIIITQGEK